MRTGRNGIIAEKCGVCCCVVVEALSVRKRCELDIAKDEQERGLFS